MRMSSLLRGEWKDEQMPSSTYIVTVTKRGTALVRFVKMFHPNRKIFKDGGHCVSTQHRDGMTHTVWVLPRAKFEAVIESGSVLWKSVAARPERDYVWTSHIQPWDSQKIACCTLPPGLSGPYFSASACDLQPAHVTFAKEENGETNHPAKLMEWLDHTRQQCRVSRTDGATCLRLASDIEVALFPQQRQ